MRRHSAEPADTTLSIGQPEWFVGGLGLLRTWSVSGMFIIFQAVFDGNSWAL
jgi:hypothetical protein